MNCHYRIQQGGVKQKLYCKQKTANRLGTRGKHVYQFQTNVTTLCGHIQPRKTHSTQASSSSAAPLDNNSNGQLKKIIMVAIGAVVLVKGVPAIISTIKNLGLSPEIGTLAESSRLQCSIAGMMAGFLHTLCGPDHLAGLTPFTIGRSALSATVLGAIWGLGHAVGQFILGVLFVCLKDSFNAFMPAMSKWGSVIVGLTLVCIGGLGAVEVRENMQKEDDGANEQLKPIGWKTAFTGVIYGLHPDSLLVVLPALALPTKSAAMAYNVMFVIGTVVAMGGYTLFIALTASAICGENKSRQNVFSLVASIVAILLGAAILLSSAFNIQLIPMLA